jgi:hypothetical protein
MASAEQTIDERICQAKAEIEKAYIGWKEVKELERRAVELRTETNAAWKKAFCELEDLEGRKSGNEERLYNHTLENLVRGGEYVVSLKDYPKAIQNLEFLLSSPLADRARWLLSRLYVQGKYDKTCITIDSREGKQNLKMADHFAEMIEDKELKIDYIKKRARIVQRIIRKMTFEADFRAVVLQQPEWKIEYDRYIETLPQEWCPYN